MINDNWHEYKHQPLSIGDIVSLSIYLYLTNFKIYYKQILIGYLWLIIPILGVAKFLAAHGLVSRLAFQKLIGKPESIKKAKTHINPRLGSFLLISIFITVVSSIIMIIAWITTGLIMFTIRLDKIFLVIEPFVESSNSVIFIFFLIVLIALLLLMLTGMFGPSIYFLTRFWLSDVSLAIESKINPFKSMIHSWQLTKGYFWRLFMLSLIASILLLPLISIFYLFSYLASWGISQLPSEVIVSTTSWELFYLLIVLLFSAALGLFFQICKTIIYYNLAIRRQGLGLEIIREE